MAIRGALTRRRRPRLTKVSDIPTWASVSSEARSVSRSRFRPSAEINGRVCLWRGNMTALQIDAVVNAANERCLGGGGIDGAIHSAAGRGLYQECKTLHGCRTGDAKITGGHLLPARHVIHTVGPIGEHADKLRSCYNRSLEVALANDVRSICFCCISTGAFGYPNERAAEVALRAVREFLEDSEHRAAIDRVVFCTFTPLDCDIYRALMPQYFPASDADGSIDVPVADSRDPPSKRSGEAGEPRTVAAGDEKEGAGSPERDGGDGTSGGGDGPGSVTTAESGAGGAGGSSA